MSGVTRLSGCPIGSGMTRLVIRAFAVMRGTSSQRRQGKKGTPGRGGKKQGVGFSTVAQSLLFEGCFFVGSSYGQWSEASGKEFFEFANEGIASQGSAGVSVAS